MPHSDHTPIAVVQTTAELRPSTAAWRAVPPTTATTTQPALAIQGIARAAALIVELSAAR